MVIEKISGETVTPASSQAKKNVTSEKSAITSVSVFNINDKSTVNKKLQEKADKNLALISDHIISKSNKKIKNIKIAGFLGCATIGIGAFAKLAFANGMLSAGTALSAGLFSLGAIGLAGLVVAGLVEYFAGESKRKAGYTKYASTIEDKERLEFSKAPEIKNDYIEKAGKNIIGSDNITLLSEKEIKDTAPEVLGQGNVCERRIYVSYPKNDGQTSDTIHIADGKIDSGKYNGISLEGIKKDTYEIPAEYKDFTKTFLDKNEKMSQKQSNKFIKIVKALQTDGIYTKSTKDNNNEEDVDIFDLSGDNLLNYGDICAIKLQTLKDKLSSQIKNSLTNKNNWNVNKLSKLLKITQDNCFDLFDLNGDGNIDEEDFTLFNNLDSNSAKFDINEDGKVDNQDIYQITRYFEAIIKRYNNKGKFLENTKKIMGGDNCIDVLKEYYENEEDKKILNTL